MTCCSRASGTSLKGTAEIRNAAAPLFRAAAWASGMIDKRFGKGGKAGTEPGVGNVDDAARSGEEDGRAPWEAWTFRLADERFERNGNGVRVRTSRVAQLSMRRG